MKYGWQQDNKGNWYYLDDLDINGRVYGGSLSGWRYLNNKWYYLNPLNNNAMQTGWCKIDGLWYYFYQNGSMASNTVIDGYKLGASGALE